MPVGESFSFETPSLSVSLSKLKANDLPSEIKIDNGAFKLPNFCDLLNQPTTQTSTKASNSIGLLYNPSDENNCTNKVINFRVIV